MQLQKVAADLEAEGIALYAISYDPPDVLAGFAERHGITYPLLSDAGSGLIRELGLLNEEAGERVEGIPHPGVVVLDADGTVAEKHFYESYRERDTGRGTPATRPRARRHARRAPDAGGVRCGPAPGRIRRIQL